MTEFFIIFNTLRNFNLSILKCVPSAMDRSVFDGRKHNRKISVNHNAAFSTRVGLYDKMINP